MNWKAEGSLLWVVLTRRKGQAANAPFLPVPFSYGGGANSYSTKLTEGSCGALQSQQPCQARVKYVNVLCWFMLNEWVDVMLILSEWLALMITL